MTVVGESGFMWGCVSWNDLPILPNGYRWVLSNREFVNVLTPGGKLMLFRWIDDTLGVCPWMGLGWGTARPYWLPFSELP